MDLACPEYGGPGQEFGRGLQTTYFLCGVHSNPLYYFLKSPAEYIIFYISRYATIHMSGPTYIGDNIYDILIDISYSYTHISYM